MPRLVSFINQDAFTVVDNQAEAERRLHYAALRAGIFHCSRRVAFNSQHAALRQRVFSQGNVAVHRGVDRFLQRRAARIVRVYDPRRLVARERLASHDNSDQ